MSKECEHIRQHQVDEELASRKRGARFMTFPKKLMKTSELVEMGFSANDLRKAAHSTYGKMVHLTVRSCPRGAFRFDTSKLEKVFSVMGRANV